MPLPGVCLRDCRPQAAFPVTPVRRRWRAAGAVAARHGARAASRHQGAGSRCSASCFAAGGPRASSSRRSFPGGLASFQPEPFDLVTGTSASRACQRSTLMTGWRLAVIQPFFFRPMIHWVIPRTYWLSVVSRTWQVRSGPQWHDGSPSAPSGYWWSIETGGDPCDACRQTMTAP